MKGALVPPDLDLDLVVRSHGWYDLPPFDWDAAKGRLSFCAEIEGAAVRIAVSRTANGISVSASPKVPVAKLGVVLSRVLDLSADLDAFHAACAARAREGFGWIAERRAGRILRAPTLFEDAVKVLATTNCTWGLTRIMVTNLVAGRGTGAFPGSAFLAGLGEARLKEEMKLGYRAPYLARFAENVASGRLDLARWEDPDRPDAEVEKEILAQPGFGPYAAQTLGRLLGRHAKLGLDSWSRKKVAELRFKGRPQKDARVERTYAVFGKHAGLAFWLDVTRDWHVGNEKLWP